MKLLSLEGSKFIMGEIPSPAGIPTINQAGSHCFFFFFCVVFGDLIHSYSGSEILDGYGLTLVGEMSEIFLCQANYGPHVFCHHKLKMLLL